MGHTPDGTPANRASRRAAARRPSVFDEMTGQRIPGGCADCTAYQTLEQRVAGIYVMTVHHDPTCPTYRARTR